MFKFTSIRWSAFTPALALALAGCAVHPPGEAEERSAALRSGKAFEKRMEDREISPLPENPTVDQLVTFAMLNNGDLEQRYWAWRAAIEQIPQDGSQTATLNIGAGTILNKGRASWSSSTLTFSNDPMTDIKWPGKLDAAARQSLENARAAGLRFLKAKYELRGKVLSAYSEYALNAELIRLEEANAQLLQLTASTTTSRNRGGSSSEQDLLTASNELDLSRNEIANRRSQLMSQQAAINALLGRVPNATLPIPASQPTRVALAYEDRELLTLAAARNPELIALADEIHGRQDAVRLARLQYVPDFNLSAGTDLVGMAQTILAQATVPAFRYEALNAAIAQAQANLRATQAGRRQAGNDLAWQVVADVALIRDSDRQLDLFEHAILPRARQVVDLGRSGYETGHSTLLEWLGPQRSLIAIQRLIANLKSTRETHLADLETITTMQVSTP